MGSFCNLAVPGTRTFNNFEVQLLVDIHTRGSAATAIGGAKSVQNFNESCKFAQCILFGLERPPLVAVELAQVWQQAPHRFCRSLIAVQWQRGCGGKPLPPLQRAVNR